jgi:uncharacterized protein YjbI with pentapeptide repeats
MAIEEHIRIVKQGSEAIARWKMYNAELSLDLSNANLRRVDLSHANLNKANLRGSNLEWADFRWADLIEADLSSANLSRADFHKADMKAAFLSRANLSNTNFEDTNLGHANLDGSLFSHTRLLNTDLREAVGLYSTKHEEASIIDMETYLKIAGELPPEFIKSNIFFNPPDSNEFCFGEPLYQLGVSREVEQAKIESTRIWVPNIEKELLKNLNNNPEMMRELSPREFEKLIAAVFKNQGFDVSLTKETRDGGYDIFAVKHDKLTGCNKYLIECKKYAEQNKVHVGIVRSLLGVVFMHQATKGIIATTSFFTKDAQKAALKHSAHIMLHDFKAITKIISSTVK